MWTRDLFVPVLVKLCDDELYVASGEVVSLAETGKHVHNVIVKHDEVVIQVKTVDKPTLTHPIYTYSVEVGSFTAWKLADLEVIG